MLKAIIIGASSGIGRELAKILALDGYEVGLTARRLEELHSLQQEIPSKTYVKQLDIAKSDSAMNAVDSLIEEMGGCDLFIINAAVNHFIRELDFEKEQQIININVLGFCAMANVAMKHFLKKQSGHLVGISSIAALRGIGMTAAYCASKAFVSNYLEGIRQKALNITVSDMKLGFVDTRLMSKDISHWVASPQKAARQIYLSICKKKNHVYVTRRWKLVGWLMKMTPQPIYDWAVSQKCLQLTKDL